ncbi:MAG: type I restriction enzyme HsdR N-terminal domain-containing protein, partial [bacterium]
KIMAGIPKKVTERYIKNVPKFQNVIKLAKDRDVNESDTVSILNDILGEVFGYDKYLEVTSEIAIRGTFCDLALKVDDKIQFLLEIKAVGTELKERHMRQTIDYGANQGIPWVILTNAQEWKVYKIRFEQPINYDLVCAFKFDELNPRNEKDQECLFLLSKEALGKNIRDEYYEKFQNVNRYILGSLILSDAVLAAIRKELRKLADGVKVEQSDIEQILRKEVLKREVVEGEDAEAAYSRVSKHYKKTSSRKERKLRSKAITTESAEDESNSDMMNDVEDDEKTQPRM